ncbi:HIT family protein [uncultured Vagococcus sp.]|uniref:HIT family protein n=1 Tax=uncultured Vagococcus sp. TaxID=189676 RepID=UPI0028D6EAFF|nr:HIT family protein [uncultured Vagococcus sp.]
MDCPFCQSDQLVMENDLAKAFFDKHPVNEGHLLVVPKRHTVTYFECTIEEKIAIDQLIQRGKVHLEETYQPDGFNIGTNAGSAAGQTIFHCHIHLIPRFTGDIDDPRGGVRGVIPEKRVY